MRSPPRHVAVGLVGCGPLSWNPRKPRRCLAALQSRSVVIFGQSDFAIGLAWHVLPSPGATRLLALGVERRPVARLYGRWSLRAQRSLPRAARDDGPPCDYADRPGGFPCRHSRLAPAGPRREYGKMLVPLGGRGANGFRWDRYLQAKAKGYEFVTYISSRALVAPGVHIGENSMIFEGAAVQSMASVGANCIVRTLANISHHVTLADHGFVAASAVVGGSASVGERCFLGLGSVVRDGVAGGRALRHRGRLRCGHSRHRSQRRLHRRAGETRAPPRGRTRQRLIRPGATPNTVAIWTSGPTVLRRLEGHHPRLQS